MKITLLLIISLILLSCGENKKKESKATVDESGMVITDNKVASENDTSKDLDFSDAWKYEGIWGDYSYLDTLRKYNSVAKTEKILGVTILEIRISKDKIETDIPYSMEPCLIDKEKYKIKINNDNTLLLVDKVTGKKQKFSKFLYNEELDADAGHYSFKYPMEKMKYIWFSGLYDMFDKEGNKIGQLDFDKYGHVNGYGDLTVYSLACQIEDNYILFSLVPEDWEQREYLIMEKMDNEYLFFAIKNFDDWDEPFVKTDLKFKLRKTR